METNTPGGPYTPPPPPPMGGGGLPPTGVPPAGGGDLVYPTTPPKDPIIVMVLNLLLAGGVGYLMMGQKMKGIVAIVAWLVLIPLTCGGGSGILAIVTAIDGYLQAQQLQQGHPVAQWTFFNDHR